MLNTNFNPFPRLYTARLCLRNLQPADAQRLFEMRSHPDVMRHINREKPAGMADIDALLERVNNNLASGDGINWALTLKEEPERLCGNIGLWRIDKPHYRAEIGYMLLPGYHRAGIMTEAVERVLDYGFNTMGLHSVEAHINPANKASAALLEKTGFIREAYFKENFFFQGRFHDTAVYSLVNSNALKL